MVVMDVFTRRIIGFGVGVAKLDGTAICRMFNRAIVKRGTAAVPPFRSRSIVSLSSVARESSCA